MPDMDHTDLINRLLDQNEQLIKALTSQSAGNSPVEIIKALTPAQIVTAAPDPAENNDPWKDDSTPPERGTLPIGDTDAWADDAMPLDYIRNGVTFGSEAPGYSSPDEPTPGLPPILPADTPPAL